MTWVRTYRAYCTHDTCGWVGKECRSEQAALDDGDEHSEAIADDRNIHDPRAGREAGQHHQPTERKDGAVMSARDKALAEMYDDLDTVIDTFEWGPRDGINGPIGDVSVDREASKLHLEVWVHNTDEPENEELQPLHATIDVDPYMPPEQQIRALIHWYLCHEADEQMWFGPERPFYPHDEEGRTIEV